MKPLILVIAIMLALPGMANADYFQLFTDTNGIACDFAPGFNTTGAVIHRTFFGAAGSRFKLAGTGLGGGGVLAFNSPYDNIGNVNSDITFLYGECLTGDIVVGTIIAVLQTGEIDVLPADGSQRLLSYNCAFEETDGFGLTSYVGSTFCHCCGATEPTTWGQVKALYR